MIGFAKLLRYLQPSVGNDYGAQVVAQEQYLQVIYRKGTFTGSYKLAVHFAAIAPLRRCHKVCRMRVANEIAENIMNGLDETKTS